LTFVKPKGSSHSIIRLNAARPTPVNRHKSRLCRRMTRRLKTFILRRLNERQYARLVQGG
jgi:hypothetical protein